MRVELSIILYAFNTEFVGFFVVSLGPSKGYVVLLKTEIVIGLITNLESKELYLVEYQQTGLP